MSIFIGILLNTLVPLFLKFGLPYVLTWLKQRFPWLPTDTIAAILKQLFGEVQAHAEVHGVDTPAYHAAVQSSVNQAVKEIHLACSGVACPPNLVK